MTYCHVDWTRFLTSTLTVKAFIWELLQCHPKPEIMATSILSPPYRSNNAILANLSYTMRTLRRSHRMVFVFHVIMECLLHEVVCTVRVLQNATSRLYVCCLYILEYIFKKNQNNKGVLFRCLFMFVFPRPHKCLARLLASLPIILLHRHVCLHTWTTHR